MSTLGSTKQADIKSATRVLDILELLAADPQGITVSQISSKLGIPRSSAHGLVHTLLRRGYLTPEHPHSKAFRLGVRLIQLGLNVGDRLELRAVARPTLERLVSATHDTALMVVAEDGQLVYVDKVVSDARSVRTDPRLSGRAPLHASSLGKALLAALDDDSVGAVVDRAGMSRFTSFTMTEKADLLADLRRTRERGYSVISHAMGWDGNASTLFLPVPGSAQAVFGGDDLRAEPPRALAQTKGG